MQLILEKPWATPTEVEEGLPSFTDSPGQWLEDVLPTSDVELAEDGSEYLPADEEGEIEDINPEKYMGVLL